MSELKPCPFCGGAPAVIEDGYKAIAVHCFNCGADITAETERKACAAWNRRAQPANEPKVVEIDQVKNEPLTLDELRGMDGELVNYMIYSPDFGVDIGNYHAKAKRWLCMALPCTVTHWMPLPEPPKGE